MSRVLPTCAALGAFAMVAACVSANPETPDSSSLSAGSSAESTADVATGRKLYAQSCARCHGFNMMNPAPGVFDLRTFPADDKLRFFTAVSAGKGAMPAWKDVLSAQELQSLWSYISASRAP